jgi:hypothetical protein
MVKLDRYMEVNKLTFKDAQTGEERTHECTHFQSFLKVKCPLDGTNLLETIGEDSTGLACPACHMDYGHIDNGCSAPEPMYSPQHLFNKITKRYQELESLIAGLQIILDDAKKTKSDYEQEAARLRPYAQTQANSKEPAKKGILIRGPNFRAASSLIRTLNQAEKHTREHPSRERYSGQQVSPLGPQNNKDSDEVECFV